MTWNILGGIATFAVVAALTMAFLADPVRRRFRRARRCPKCWYDMSHSPGMTCSECGNTAKREKQLLKWRRKWRWVALALTIWIVADQAGRVQDIRERGWMAAVPTTALAAAWPTMRPNMLRVGQLPHLATGPQTWSDHLWVELTRERIERGRSNRLHRAILTAWARRLDGESFQHIDPWPSVTEMVAGTTRWKGDWGLHWSPAPQEVREKNLDVAIITRPVWPEGETVWVLVWPQRCWHQQRLIGLPRIRDGALEWRCEQVPMNAGCLFFRPTATPMPIGVVSAQRKAFQFRCVRQVRQNAHTVDAKRWMTVDEFPLVVRYEIAESIDEVIRPLRDESFDEFLRSALLPRLGRNVRAGSEASACALSLLPSTWSIVLFLEHLEDIALAVYVEVLEGGTVVAVGEVCYSLIITPDNDRLLTPDTEWIDLTVHDAAALERIFDGALAEVRLRGDARLALRNIVANRYWAGEMTLPLHAPTPWR